MMLPWAHYAHYAHFEHNPLTAHTAHYAHIAMLDYPVDFHEENCPLWEFEKRVTDRRTDLPTDGLTYPHRY